MAVSRVQTRRGCGKFRIGDPGPTVPAFSGCPHGLKSKTLLTSCANMIRVSVACVTRETASRDGTSHRPKAALTRPDTPLPTIHAHPPFRPPSAADSGAAKSTGAAIQRCHGARQGPGRGGPLRAGDRSGCGRRGWAARRAMRIARNAVPEV